MIPREIAIRNLGPLPPPGSYAIEAWDDPPRLALLSSAGVELAYQFPTIAERDAGHVKLVAAFRAAGGGA